MELAIDSKTNVFNFSTVVVEAGRVDARATCLMDQLSGKQIVKAKRLARDLDEDANDVSAELYGCQLNELSKRGAEELIYYLESLVNSPRVAAARMAG